VTTGRRSAWLAIGVARYVFYLRANSFMPGNISILYVGNDLHLRLDEQ
jgi:hypothetical protein